jgi:hypothetical protein
MRTSINKEVAMNDLREIAATLRQAADALDRLAGGAPRPIRTESMRTRIEGAIGSEWRTIYEIVDAAGCSRSRASEVLNQLLAAGLVERDGDELGGQRRPNRWRRVVVSSRPFLETTQRA